MLINITYQRQDRIDKKQWNNEKITIYNVKKVVFGDNYKDWHLIAINQDGERKAIWYKRLMEDLNKCNEIRRIKITIYEN